MCHGVKDYAGFRPNNGSTGADGLTNEQWMNNSNPNWNNPMYASLMDFVHESNIQMQEVSARINSIDFKINGVSLGRLSSIDYIVWQTQMGEYKNPDTDPISGFTFRFTSPAARVAAGAGDATSGGGTKYFTENGNLLWDQNSSNLPTRVVVIPDNRVHYVNHAIEDFKNGKISISTLQGVSETNGKQWDLRTNVNGETYMVKPYDFNYYFMALIYNGVEAYNHVYGDTKGEVLNLITDKTFDIYTTGVKINW